MVITNMEIDIRIVSVTEQSSLWSRSLSTTVKYTFPNAAVQQHTPSEPDGGAQVEGIFLSVLGASHFVSKHV